MKKLVLPMSEIMSLIVEPNQARINNENNIMFAIVGDSLLIMTGDFTGIDTDADLGEIIKRNFG